MENTETPAFELLKQCNFKLANLITPDYRFVAWIIYSTQHKCFIAGVDTYTNDNQNLATVISKALDNSPFDAIKQIYDEISAWHNDGQIPLTKLYDWD